MPTNGFGALRVHGTSLVSLLLVCLLMVGVSSELQAETYRVKAGQLLQLPDAVEGSVSIELAEQAHLLIPASIDTLNLKRLVMSRDSSLRLSPRDKPVTVHIQQAILAQGSRISGAGLDGEAGVPGGAGVDLKLAIQRFDIHALSIDLRGGQGGNGLPGADGLAGRDARCWGRSSKQGRSGQNGSDGLPGGRGGNLELSLGQGVGIERVVTDLRGGLGGEGGAPGKAGATGKSAQCWLYSVSGAKVTASEGEPGKRTDSGSDGVLLKK